MWLSRLLTTSLFGALLAHGAVAQSGSQNPDQKISSTYADTVTLLKSFDDVEGAGIARLFAVGDLRTDDLVAACRSGNEDIESPAMLTLQLLGNPECRACFDAIAPKNGRFSFFCGGKLGEADYARILKWLKIRPTCKEDDCTEDNAIVMDDGLVYALILDGSPRAQSVLEEALKLEKEEGMQDTTTGEALSRFRSMIVEARAIGHDIKIEPATLEKTVCKSAFFLSAGDRETCSVRLLARNSKDDRILLEVSYHCGLKCSSGYYVVLRRESSDVWQYALIRMAWIT